MARDPANFKNSTQLSTTAADIVSVIPASTKAVIRKLSFRNTGTSTRLVTVYLIASGGTAGTTNELTVKSIPAGREWNAIIAQGEILEVGMKLQAKVDSGTDVNANCSGANIT